MNIASLLGHTLEIFAHIDHNSHPPDQTVRQFLRERRYLGAKDRRFISETIFGIIRHRRLLETLVEQYGREFPSTQLSDERQHRLLPLYVVLALSVEQRRVESVQKAVGSYWQTFFPNLSLEHFVGWITEHSHLDFLPDDKTVRLGVKYSFLDWMVERWQEDFGDETEELLRSLNVPGPTAIRVNVLKATREECKERLEKEGIHTELSRLSPHGLIASKRFNRDASNAFREGWFEIQDEGSQLISLLAAPRPGNTLIDACAGAGGKTLHLATLMNDEGVVLAYDASEKRLNKQRERIERARLRSIRVYSPSKQIPSEFVGRANVVLVDAPCSGSGTIRRNPYIKWNLTESLIEHYAEMQKKILEGFAPFVAPEGRLVYATCSLFRKENEEVVEEFLAKHAEFSPSPPKTDMVNLDTTFYSTTPFIKLLPHRHGTDGFFVAILERKR